MLEVWDSTKEQDEVDRKIMKLEKELRLANQENTKLKERVQYLEETHQRMLHRLDRRT